MFTWLGNELTSVLRSYVLNVVSALMTDITPIALTAMTIWVLLYGWAVLRNEVSETVPSFAWKVTKIGLVLALALQSGTYITNIADAANGLATGVATTFLPPSVTPGIVTSPYALLDDFNDDASQQVNDIMKDAGITRLDLVLAAVIFSIGSVVFLCIAVFIVTLATVLMNFILGVGPVFVLCLAWKPTQRFFDSWLSMLLNTAVMTWFAFFALGLSTFIADQMFTAIAAGGGFLGLTFNVIGEAIRYCVLMLVMAIICFQAPGLAAALTGGAAVQQGIQMIQNAMMVASLRSSASSSRSVAAAPNAAGGTLRPTLAMQQVASRVGSMARQGYGSVRTAAYRLAALRGRT